MKLFKKLLAGAAVAAALATSANAATVTVADITWDTESLFPDFGSTSATVRQFINSVTGELTGFGIITTFNGTPSSVFAPTGELTFQFGAYLPSGPILTPTTASQVLTYNGGYVRIYSDSGAGVAVPNPADHNTLTATNTGDGTLFLATIGHADSAGDTFTGTTTGTGGTGLGQLDVDFGFLGGGAAAAYFDTNTIDDVLNASFTDADLGFSSSLQRFAGSPSFLNMFGTAVIAGDTVAVPEPASQALVGLVLLGLVGSRRRKSV